VTDTFLEFIMRLVFTVLLAALISSCSSLSKVPSSPAYKPHNFELHESGHIVVQAQINEKPVYLVVDTGAGATVIDDKAAAFLGLNVIDENKGGAIGAGGAGITILASPGNRFVFAGTQSNDFKFHVMSLAHVVKALSTADRPISGVIGADWLDKHGAVIRYSDHTISATK
jgi:Aspartyl protease